MSNNMSVEVNKIFKGEVASVQNYGAFIKVPSWGRTQGLVHKSQISSARVDDASEVLALNDVVWCKVISVSDDNKIALSMKVVDQGSGRDLDPNGVQTSLDAQHRKERGGYRESNAITLDAVYKTKCSQCGVMGHLSKNCFKLPEGKSYELIPEPEVDKKIFGSAEDRLKRLAGYDFSEGSKGSQEKEAKEFKKKRKKEKKRKYSDNNSSDESPEKKPKYRCKKMDVSNSLDESSRKQVTRAKHETESESSDASHDLNFKKSSQKYKMSSHLRERSHSPVSRGGSYLKKTQKFDRRKMDNADSHSSVDMAIDKKKEHRKIKYKFDSDSSSDSSTTRSKHKRAKKQKKRRK